MSLIHSIFKLFKADAAAVDSSGEGNSVIPADIETEGPDDGRKLTVNSYVSMKSNTSRSHTIELRYSAYGEKSQMMCTTTHAVRGSSATEGSDNALATSIDLEGRPVASAVLVMDGEEGLAADDAFKQELRSLRQEHSFRVCEISDLQISRENKSRRALGAMFHVLYLYARQARQMKIIVAQTRMNRVPVLEKMLGYKVLAQRGKDVLMVLDLDDMRREQRQWGGQKEDAVDPPCVLYPYFFPSKDEPGLLFRVLEHLGTTA